MGKEVGGTQTKDGDASKWCVGKEVGTPRLDFSATGRKRERGLTAGLEPLYNHNKAEGPESQDE